MDMKKETQSRLVAIAEEMRRAADAMERDGDTVDPSWLRGWAELLECEKED